MDEHTLREKLTPAQYRVMRERGDEEPFVGRYWDHDERGLYACAACDRVLFSSLQKCDVGTGWPSFTKPIRQKNIALVHSGERQEVRCSRCQSHLGYLIEEGERHYQVNSVCLTFVELGDIELEEEKEKEETGSDQTTRASASALTVVSLAGGGIAAGAAAAIIVGATTLLCFAPGVSLSPSPSATPSASVIVPVSTRTPAPTPLPTPTPTPAPAGTASGSASPDSSTGTR